MQTITKVTSNTGQRDRKKLEVMKTKTLFFRFSALLAFFLLFGLSTFAQKERLQTAFIFQLTRLIEWCPDGKQGNFVIGVLGNEPTLMAELAALKSRRVGTQEIEIVTFNSIDAITRTNIIFVPENQFDNLSAITSKLSGTCSLIVTDRMGGANRGAGVSIPFNDRQGKLEFEINRGFMRRNSLSVSDQLYNIASNVY